MGSKHMGSKHMGVNNGSLMPYLKPGSGATAGPWCSPLRRLPRWARLPHVMPQTNEECVVASTKRRSELAGELGNVLKMVDERSPFA